MGQAENKQVEITSNNIEEAMILGLGKQVNLIKSNKEGCFLTGFNPFEEGLQQNQGETNLSIGVELVPATPGVFGLAFEIRSFKQRSFKRRPFRGIIFKRIIFVQFKYVKSKFKRMIFIWRG